MIELTFLFGSVRERRARGLAAFFEDLPWLCRGALAECDLGVRTSADVCVCVARSRGALPDSVSARLAFWAWRLGGSMSVEQHPSPPVTPRVSPLRCCDTVIHAVTPGLVGTAARALLIRLPGVALHLVPGTLALQLEIGSPDCSGLRFERRWGALFVPSPRLPPLGDDVAVRVRSPGGEELELEGTVTAIRAAGEDGPGSPAGFALGLVALTARKTEALEALAGPRSNANRRSAPRYPVRARAKVSLRTAEEGARSASGTLLARAGRIALAEEDRVENLSQGGAFVRTTETLPPGTPIRLDMELPDGSAVSAPAVVTRRNDRGVGVQFRLNAEGEAAVGEAVARVASRRRRALVVDDDPLARRMLGDALAGCGFEVFAADDGTAGLRVLTDELLGLDLLVTDVHMPALGGEKMVELIRGIGGERDLAIVVVSGDRDPGLEQRLMAAGADAVIAKGQGLAAITDCAERAVLRRRGNGAQPGLGLAHSA